MLIAIETAPHGAHERRGHRDSSHTLIGKFNLVVPVDDGLTTSHLILNMGEGRVAVNHLEQDAAKRPYVARLAKFHQLRTFEPRRKVPSIVCRGEGIVIGIHQAFRRHVIRGADLCLAVHIDRLVGLDSIGDAKVDELQTTLNNDEIGGLEITVDNIVSVYSSQAFEHFFPVEADEDRVKLDPFRVLANP